ncbi:MAG: hypothetical protein A2632_00610 [Candidatus Pacebacteria bacterium RIFCSPHIGHO2_01_FULL_46_16]|nr:MAG: hypothetical protein A2632_00610 [Candidatus Pacebacteria bacterium RIFCSPHIGHO2_01_FULL_46_16]OGJ21695.1 MAG: hypothetical protein A3J60_03595 [Candidatus Pacebacteria bacterium RIFCSPHIGHO2_02_FULL_46_9]OGJ38701.1 MAG: hypothetical protein A3A82_03155 [Candidatus Pacebacteria bacterium RIFCSPLOWO2_01_FULL_47_12]
MSLSSKNEVNQQLAESKVILNIPEHILEPGSILYHSSRAPQVLVASEKFDPSQSNNSGCIFFTAGAEVRTTNVSVLVEQRLRLLDLQGNTRKIQRQLQQIGSDPVTYAKALGLDGIHSDSTSIRFARHTTEIQLFPEALEKLGAISIFPSLPGAI